MTAVPTTSSTLTDAQLATLFQYNVEAYKSFEKLAEALPNPMTATVFKQFAADEREIRDLLELKIASLGREPVRITLGDDRNFAQLLEGELSFRESAEFLIGRERTMKRKLREMIDGSTPADRNLLVWVESVKRAHVVELERELELIRGDADWWKREDARWRVVNGAPA